MVIIVACCIIALAGPSDAITAVSVCVCHEKKGSDHDAYKEIATYCSATKAQNSEHNVEVADKNCDLKHVSCKGWERVFVLFSDASSDRLIQ